MRPEGFQGQHPALFECREVGGGGRRCGIGEARYRKQKDPGLGGRGQGSSLPPPLPCTVWLVVSAASPTNQIYSRFYAMLVTQSTVIFHRVHKQVKPTTAQTKRAKQNHLHAPGTSHMPTQLPFRGLGLPEGVGRE